MPSPPGRHRRWQQPLLHDVHTRIGWPARPPPIRARHALLSVSWARASASTWACAASGQVPAPLLYPPGYRPSRYARSRGPPHTPLALTRIKNGPPARSVSCTLYKCTAISARPALPHSLDCTVSASPRACPFPPPLPTARAAWTAHALGPARRTLLLALSRHCTACTSPDIIVSASSVAGQPFAPRGPRGLLTHSARRAAPSCSLSRAIVLRAPLPT